MTLGSGVCLSGTSKVGLTCWKLIISLFLHQQRKENKTEIKGENTLSNPDQLVPNFHSSHPLLTDCQYDYFFYTNSGCQNNFESTSVENKSEVTLRSVVT